MKHDPWAMANQKQNRDGVIVGSIPIFAVFYGIWDNRTKPQHPICSSGAKPRAR